MPFANKFNNINIATVYIILLTLMSVALGFFCTSVYGAGIAGDSIHYLSVADNLLKGKGFVDAYGMPLIWFPPLLSIIFAGISYVTNLDVFISAWFFNIFLLGFNVLLSSFWLYKFFRDRWVYFFIGSLFIFLSPSNIRMHSSVLSDPLYLTFSLLFFIAGWTYIQKRSWLSFFGMIALAILSPLLRYSGFSQIVAGSLIIVYAYRNKFSVGLPLAAAFGIFTFLPVGLWVYFHNYILTGTIWGSSSIENADVWVNFLQALRKILYWFVPYRPITNDGLLEPLILLFSGFLLLLLINRKEQWKNWLYFFSHPAIVSMMIFAMVYFSSTTLNIVTVHHKDLFSDRYYVIIMLPVVVVLLSIFDKLILPRLRISQKHIFGGIILLFMLWSIYPVAKIVEFLEICRNGSEHMYNTYNTRQFNESETVKQTKLLLAQRPNMNLYSNIPPVIWFFTRHKMELLPAKNQDEMGAKFSGDLPGYVVWFEPDPYQIFNSPLDYSDIAKANATQKLQDGIIYEISILE